MPIVATIRRLVRQIARRTTRPAAGISSAPTEGSWLSSGRSGSGSTISSRRANRGSPPDSAYDGPARSSTSDDNNALNRESTQSGRQNRPSTDATAVSDEESDEFVQLLADENPWLAPVLHNLDLIHPIDELVRDVLTQPDWESHFRSLGDVSESELADFMVRETTELMEEGHMHNGHAGVYFLVKF